FPAVHHKVKQSIVAVRKDFTYISHAVPPDANNEYVALTVKNDRCIFTIIAAYIPPNTQFKVQPHPWL
ncbi:hypothetical protein HPB47_025550, partial [Ixodes persulcatus]